jgi:hypothetical protein
MPESMTLVMGSSSVKILLKEKQQIPLLKILLSMEEIILYLLMTRQVTRGSPPLFML